MTNPYAPPPVRERTFMLPSAVWWIPIGALAFALATSAWRGDWNAVSLLGVILAVTCIAPWFTRVEVTSEDPEESDGSLPMPSWEFRGAQSFLDGQPIIHGGIAYFVVPENDELFLAASPSTSNTNERMRLITSEALRHLPSFLAEHPSLHDHLVGRKLVVRMTASYHSLGATFLQEKTLEWDILDKTLEREPRDED